jgi:hypothetical protein
MDEDPLSFLQHGTKEPNATAPSAIDEVRVLSIFFASDRLRRLLTRPQVGSSCRRSYRHRLALRRRYIPSASADIAATSTATSSYGPTPTATPAAPARTGGRWPTLGFSRRIRRLPRRSRATPLTTRPWNSWSRDARVNSQDV